MEVISASTEQTKKLAGAVAKKIGPGITIALFGDLGSGKTTFVNFLVKALGFDSRVQSPTFVIHRRYFNSGQPIDTIHHLDFYRLTSEEEVLDIDLPFMLREPHSLVLIEWPELAMNFLPPDTVKLHFETIDENTKKVVVEGLE